MITREGVVGLCILAIITLLLVLLFDYRILAISLPLGLGWALFCRNPVRRVPREPGVWVAPADGKVVEIQQLPDGRHRMGIFMNVWNVHVNRAPEDGRILSVMRQKGRFLPAFDERAKRLNEQVITTVSNPGGTYQIVQIAGILARRIRFWRTPDQYLKRGETLGMILLGSRVDVIFPPGVHVTVTMGQKTRAGETIIARHNHAFTGEKVEEETKTG